ncbi:hypothetical protein AK812_SmicGene20790 [Symbiodinium microadriaticum]|uniref:Uncharacterized protein n=1 Tax=Symbiodinium microadriaticum TaxID=2951 RepID=A0A1Q9DP37_SYMMI|nr:hypothetical protein AK812_SmicGene20790 [Symbiodinium microadriaticum]
MSNVIYLVRASADSSSVALTLPLPTNLLRSYGSEAKMELRETVLERDVNEGKQSLKALDLIAQEGFEAYNFSKRGVLEF